MESVVCPDDRASGLIQFYGANRTGRFAGRLIQVQNLPQNHLPDLKQARRLVLDKRFDAVELSTAPSRWCSPIPMGNKHTLRLSA